MKVNGLYRFESLVQDLIEGKIARLFGGRLEPLDLANRLARIMIDHSENGAGPVIFSIHLNADDYRMLTYANPNLAENIADTAWQIWQHSTSKKMERPVVNLVQDSTLAKHKVIIFDQTAPRLDQHQNTAIISPRMKGSVALKELQARDAFLIIQGRRHVPLRKPVTTIGRHMDNDIVIDKPVVSRKHAQIRWRFGRFVLYDISGRGQTSVNAIPTLEQPLKSGDVIALSQVMLIYGEGFDNDLSGQNDSDTKTLFPPPNS